MNFIDKEHEEFINYESNNGEYLIKEKIIDRSDNNIVGLYIRTNEKKDISVNEAVLNQIKELEDYCKSKNINNKVYYIDVGKSSLDKNRKALQQMISDIKENKINMVLVTDLAKFSRKPLEVETLLLEDYMKVINIISLDQSIEDLLKNRENLINTILKEQEVEL